MQGVNPPPPQKKKKKKKIVQIVPCILANISCNFRENLFIRFPVMLLTDKQTNRQTKLQTNRDDSITFAVRWW